LRSLAILDSRPPDSPNQRVSGSCIEGAAGERPTGTRKGVAGPLTGFCDALSGGEARCRPWHQETAPSAPAGCSRPGLPGRVRRSGSDLPAPEWKGGGRGRLLSVYEGPYPRALQVDAGALAPVQNDDPGDIPVTPAPPGTPPRPRGLLAFHDSSSPDPPTLSRRPRSHVVGSLRHRLLPDN